MPRKSKAVPLSAQPGLYAQGQLMHHFHGTYWATIGLLFRSADHARAALAELGPGWTVSPKQGNALGWNGHGEALEAVIAQLGMLGADTAAIKSTRKSIDFGEPFEILIPVT